ncbi:class II aldolase/adducin family protein [Paramaledivibacter caminithermalis]|jgi:L-fuculose-phosphate aldolase|uniref:L-fuculose-phosphate aldolase n=1 Tax=Paramaledivibacter caminithermalis (strain DSM 15212 / CIP 107654 / DViRD3) TaxID=1121301 RepID=A0A1M6P4X0_PARC5|nr:class II aldolase/adducin family protein [Paramaledivibacter caminithermalis]SHK03007.1 L-fuculose-phosphate aldolase [Paramaledivibacter caminithermalis DSM 15212]
MNFARNEMKIRQDICQIGQKLYDKGFVAANDGNISAKISPNEIIVTPTGVSKGGMKPSDLVKMTLDGKVLSNNARPSSEVKMHIEVYKLNPQINGVVHAHPPIATAFAVARLPMETPILSEAVVNLGVVPVADYALPGTDEVPESIKPYVLDYNAVLLANHGLLTWGNDLTQAFFRMESVEHYGKILLYVNQIGDPKEFNCAQIDALLDIRKNIGIKSGGIPTCKVEGRDTDINTKSSNIDRQELVKMITKEVINQLKSR